MGNIPVSGHKNLPVSYYCMPGSTGASQPMAPANDHMIFNNPVRPDPRAVLNQGYFKNNINDNVKVDRPFGLNSNTDDPVSFGKPFQTPQQDSIVSSINDGSGVTQPVSDMRGGSATLRSYREITMERKTAEKTRRMGKSIEESINLRTRTNSNPADTPSAAINSVAPSSQGSGNRNSWSIANRETNQTSQYNSTAMKPPPSIDYQSEAYEIRSSERGYGTPDVHQDRAVAQVTTRLQARYAGNTFKKEFSSTYGRAASVNSSYQKGGYTARRRERDYDEFTGHGDSWERDENLNTYNRRMEGSRAWGSRNNSFVPDGNLRKPDWNNTQLTPFTKNFYKPHPNAENRPVEELQKFYEANEITVKGNAPKPILNFDEANLPDYAADAIKKSGFDTPTPIQAIGWPIAMSGLNMVGVAQTGSGKTLGDTNSKMLYTSKVFPYFKFIRNASTKASKQSTSKKVTSSESDMYTSTILLPKTDFPLHLKGMKRTLQDEKVINECGFHNLYNWQQQNVKGPEYVLHDGPPYANGVAHMGHAINKILKDITTRHKLLQGHKIHYKPGWDCHGLPIELKAMTGEKVANLSPLTIRQKARKFAAEAIKDQRAVFKSWGVMADWENGCYFTFDKSYVKNELQQFLRLYNQGIIYRDVKPVFWSPSSRTALAEAELEYRDDHVSTAVYVSVRVTNAPDAWGSDVYSLLWTTTPWTLPANQAVAYSPALTYCLVTIEDRQGSYLVASALVDQLSSTLGKKVTVINSVEGSVIPTLRYKHPIYDSETLPFLASEHVTPDKGTGLVHTAPAHGPDDFKLAKKYNMPVTSLVDEAGCYTAEAGEQLAGQEVLTKGTHEVLKLCKERDVLVHSAPYSHSYPYDWRTGLPIIIRASLQWFLDTTQVKQQALDCLKTVSVVPERGTASLMAQVQTRPFWCISRQRSWGVPIPVLYTSDGGPVISQELMDHYCHLLDTEGDDFWWSSPISNLAPSHLLEKMNITSKDIKRGLDVLDIWLDSGLSWSAVLEGNQSADLYLEGLDQFNGWFQSSLITSVALRKTPPYKTIFFHGFAVDDKGMKMSKSVGNVINPQDIVYGGRDTKKQPTYGVDVLRWWVAAHATQHANVPVSETTLSDSKGSVHRLRMVFKFLLGTLHNLPQHAKAPSLGVLDCYMLHCLHGLEKQVMEYYNEFQYNKVCQTMMNFVSKEVSSLYCHSIKDRLYCDEEDSERRRAAQLVSFQILNTLTRLVAPIVPIMAEEVHSYNPVKVAQQLFHTVGPCTQESWHKPESATVMEAALEVKREVARLTPLNCTNWELAATVVAPSPTYEMLQVLQEEEESCESELAEILQVSRVTLRHNSNSTDKCTVEVGLVGAHRCERCRRHTAPAADQLCPRCDRVVGALK